ncbi:MAG: hypothetical protein M3376_12000 [Actinomycetota bacterium]|nr:hypothetical protein [Actinomycetota bacterium]
MQSVTVVCRICCPPAKRSNDLGRTVTLRKAGCLTREISLQMRTGQITEAPSPITVSSEDPDADVVRQRQLTVALGVTALLAAAVWVVATLALPAVDLRPASQLHFLSVHANPDNLKPEPIEQQRYLVAVAAALVLPLLIALAASRASVRQRFPASAALPMQLGVVGLVVAAWVADPRALERFLPATRDIWLVGAAALLIAGGLLRHRIAGWTQVSGHTWESASGLIALLATTILCLAGLYHDDDVVTSIAATGYHLPFTFSEVYAVAGGHTPLVDWTPQYTVLLPYLLAPFLDLRSYSIGSFTAAMVIMSTGALMMGYGALRLLTGRPLRALALYLPVLCVGLVPVFRVDDQAHTIATYFGVMPLRYAAPLACLLAVAAFARFGSGRRREWGLLGLLAGAVMLNNFEFGLPAAVATILAAALCDMQSHTRNAWRRTVLRASGWLTIGMILAVAGVVSLTLIRSGQLPDFGQLVYFSRQFATAGFFMLPIDTVFGLPGIILLTFVTAIALGATPVLLGDRAPDARSRVRTAVLVHTGVFGLGVYAYWVGRSADAVLAATFLVWAFALAALAFEGLRFARAFSATRRSGAPLYALAVSMFVVVGLAGFREATYGFDQLGRSMKHNGEIPIATQGAVVSFTRTCIAAGTNVGMFVPFGLRVADAANVRDRFPYNHPGSVVTQEQVDHAFDVLEEHDTQLIVTGAVPAELTSTMRRRGFRRLIRGPNPVRSGFETADTGPVLELWGTAARSGVLCGPNA